MSDTAKAPIIAGICHSGKSRRMIKTRHSPKATICAVIVLPMRAADRVFPTAYALRRWLQSNLEPHLHEGPVPEPLADAADVATAPIAIVATTEPT